MKEKMWLWRKNGNNSRGTAVGVTVTGVQLILWVFRFLKNIQIVIIVTVFFYRKLFENNLEREHTSSIYNTKLYD